MKADLTNTLNIEKGKYKKGEIVWVREPAKVEDVSSDGLAIVCEYKADGKRIEIDTPERFLPDMKTGKMKRWIEERQSVPNGCIKEMARIFLEITDVRVERLRDIEKEDYEREGYPKFFCNKNPLNWFAEQWDKTAPYGYKWKDNPYVFVYSFKRREDV